MGSLSKHGYGAKPAQLVAVMLLLVPSSFLMGQGNGMSCIAAHYKVIALPLRPVHINENRQIAGTTTGHRAALWTEQFGLHELPLPAGFYNSEGVAVNNSGHVVGVVYDRTFGKHQAFTFANGVLTLLAGEQSRAYDISDSDEIVGESLLPGKTTTGPVSWTRNTIRQLGGVVADLPRVSTKMEKRSAMRMTKPDVIKHFCGTRVAASSRLDHPTVTVRQSA